MTNPERLVRFFAPVNGEFKLGGRYQIEGNAEGTITECDPPKFFAATWEFGGELSWIKVRIDPDGDARSRLTLTHICPIDDHWEKYGPGAGDVEWDLTLLGLEAHLSNKAFDRDAGHAFMTSDEARLSWSVPVMLGDEKRLKRERIRHRPKPLQNGRLRSTQARNLRRANDACFRCSRRSGSTTDSRITRDWRATCPVTSLK